MRHPPVLGARVCLCVCARVRWRVGPLLRLRRLLPCGLAREDHTVCTSPAGAWGTRSSQRDPQPCPFHSVFNLEVMGLHLEAGTLGSRRGSRL